MDVEILKKLTMLQIIRVRAQEKLLTIDKKSYSVACENLKKRNQTIASIKTDNDDLKKYSNKKYVLESPAHRERVKVRKYWLDYDQEMHEYYHDQEVATKNECENNYSNSKKKWYKEKRKAELFNNHLKANILKKSSIIDNREDEHSQEALFIHGDT